MQAPSSPTFSSTSDDDADFADAVAEPLSLDGTLKPSSPGTGPTNGKAPVPAFPAGDAGDDEPDAELSPTKAPAKRALSSKAQKRKDAKDKKAQPLAAPPMPAAPVVAKQSEPIPSEPEPETEPEPVVVDDPEPEVTELRIEHSDDDDEDEDQSNTPTASSPRASAGPSSPPEQLEPEPFDFSRTSLTETSIRGPPPAPLASPPALPSRSGAADPSRHFSLSSLSPPETPSAFTSVTEHLSSAPAHVDVSDGASPSISGSVWRNSAMGNGKAGAGLVDVNLGDDAVEEEDEMLDEHEGLGTGEGDVTRSPKANGSAKANGKESADGREEKKEEFNFLLQRLESQ